MRPREPLLPRRGDGYCELPLGGREVMRFDVTSLTFRLESWIEDDDFFVITFEEPLVLDRGGGRWAFDLGNQPPTAMAPALILVGLEVERALAYDDGNLEIRFTDGTRLATEAGGWEVRWPDRGSYDWTFSASPGGELRVQRPTGGPDVG